MAPPQQNGFSIVTSTQEFLAEARRALLARDFRTAHGASLLALREDSRCAEAFFILGLIGAEHDNFEKAGELFQRAIAIDPAPAAYHAHLGKALIRQRREAEAFAAAEAAAARGPKDALTFDTIGVIFSHAGQHDRAIPFFEEAVARDPANDRYLRNLGVSAQFSGDFETAEKAFRAELKHAPHRRRPYAALVHLRKQTREENFIAELERQFAAETEIDAKLQIGHALAKTYDDLGDCETALDWLLKAKAPKAAAVGDMTAHAEKLFAAAREAFAATPEGRGSMREDAIFVIGMPRTGTTLMDRIVSSHPDVASAGELGHVARLSAEMALPLVAPPASDAKVMAATARIDLVAFAESYLAAARARIGDEKHVLDKMPINFLYAGLIHRAMPNARIICLRRDPMDACLSNFRQIFNGEAAHYWYSYGLETTARYYALFDRLMAHWRAVLPPDRFTEVQYESVVADLEGEARRLIDFCGLPWDDRCLNFHENEAPVATPSAVQVRNPIYSSSIGRWRRYGPGLEPLRAALAAAGVTLRDAAASA